MSVRHRWLFLCLPVFLLTVFLFPVESIAPTFNVGSGVIVGETTTAQLTFDNATTPLIEIDFLNASPRFSVRGHEPNGGNIRWNQSLPSGANGTWYVLTRLPPSVTGPATGVYSNPIFTLSGTGNGTVIVSWPTVTVHFFYSRDGIGIIAFIFALTAIGLLAARSRR